jgi:DNA repair protein SbcD/Mre11
MFLVLPDENLRSNHSGVYSHVGNIEIVTRILHCADLHLSVQEKVYSLSVLSEIAGLATEKKVNLLLFAGDTFDSFVDAEALRADFKQRIDPIGNSVTVLVLPGNHEDLQRGARRLGSFEFGKARLLDEEPFGILEFPDMDLISIPHRKSYADYREWAMPARRRRFRIITAHCIVSGLGIPFDEGEEMVSVIDPDLFHRAGADYAALGHIHSARAIRIESTSPDAQARTRTLILSYPGSARVCRKGETGPRCASLIEVGEEIRATSLVLKSAGQYREIVLDVGLDGAIPDIEHLSHEWDPSDRIDISISGIVEDENAFKGAADKLADALRPQLRAVNVIRDGVSVLEGISSEPIARKFLELCEKVRPAESAPDFPVWRKAREVGLLKLKKVLGGRV